MLVASIKVVRASSVWTADGGIGIDGVEIIVSGKGSGGETEGRIVSVLKCPVVAGGVD